MTNSQTMQDEWSAHADKAADFANYFVAYGYLGHQKRMLEDTVRMRAYHGAIMRNKELFGGKIVLDGKLFALPVYLTTKSSYLNAIYFSWIVGAGSGVLSIWAAQAGAAKVYAIEYTDMANLARKNVAKNGFSQVIEVIQSSVEDLHLPQKVDIIISEWMGYMLLRESMLDSVIKARDMWLNVDGLLFPSHATIYLGAVSHEQGWYICYE